MTPPDNKGEEQETDETTYDGIAMIADWPPRPETRPDKRAQEKR